MKNITKIGLISLFLSAFPAWSNSPYTAARNGDLEALRQYRFEGIDLFIPDERGFIPYELVALHADPDKADVLKRHVEVMLWLKEYQADKHRYGKATISLIQAGLNALGYQAGHPDGVMGTHTADAIRAYQKDNDLAQTGRPGPQWLGMFYQDIIKDTQFKLSKLGYNTHGTDGLMGEKTRNAMLKFRAQNSIEQPDYAYIDGALLATVDDQFNQQESRRKAAIAEKARQATQQKNRYAQAGLKALGYRIGKIDGMAGSKTANAVKAFQKKYRLPVTGELNAATSAKMKTVFLKDTQKKLNALGYAVGNPDGKMGKRTLAAIRQYRSRRGLPSGTLDADLLSSLQGRYAAQQARHQTAKADAKRKSQYRIRYAQAGLRTLGYRIGSIDGMMGGKTQKALKAFQKRYRLKQTGWVDDKTYAKMQTIFLKETQRKLNALGYQVGKPDGQMGARTQRAVKRFRRAMKLSGSGVSADFIAAVDNRYDRRTPAKKSRTVARKSKQPSTRKNSKNSTKKTIKTVIKTRASDDVVTSSRKKTTPKRTTKKTVAVATSRKKVSRVGGRSAKGRMSFKRKSGRVIGCSIAGRNIPIEWCEPFYPLPKNNHCEATFKPSGAVINLWCK